MKEVFRQGYSDSGANLQIPKTTECKIRVSLGVHGVTLMFLNALMS